MRFVKSVDAFFDIYSSLDIRVAAYWHNDKWKAAFTIIRFSRKSVDDVKIIHEELWKTHKRIENEKFRIFLGVIDSRLWEDFKKNWIQGKIVLDEDEIETTNQGDLNYESNLPSSHSYTDNVESKWDSYHVSIPTNIDSLQPKLRDFDVEASKKNYKDIQEYIAEILEVPRSEFQQNGFNKFTAPVYFKIKTQVFDENFIHLSCEGISSKLSGEVKIHETEGYDRAGPFKSKAEFTQKDVVTLESMEFSIENKSIAVSSDDHFNIIFSRNGIIIANESGPTSIYWRKSSATNPIFTVFEEFVPLEEFEEMLLDPKSIKIPKEGKKIPPEKVFERSISWLLNLLRMPSIHLQEKDTVGIEKMSADIISSHERDYILLSHPTIATKLDDAIDKAVNTQQKLEKKVAENVRIISVIFTPNSIPQQKSSLAVNDIVLMGKEEISQVLAHLKKGSIDEARNMILIPPDSTLSGL